MQSRASLTAHCEAAGRGNQSRGQFVAHNAHSALRAKRVSFASSDAEPFFEEESDYEYLFICMYICIYICVSGYLTMIVFSVL